MAKGKLACHIASNRVQYLLYTTVIRLKCLNVPCLPHPVKFHLFIVVRLVMLKQIEFAIFGS